MKDLLFVNLIAPDFDPFYERLARYLADKGLPITTAPEVPFAGRQKLFDEGAVEVAALCGLAYVRRLREPKAAVELVAASVSRGERYQGRAIYFTDLVVHADAHVDRFAALRGGILAYDQVDSHVGYNVVRYQLSTLGEKENFFGKAVPTGSPEKALRLVLAGQADVAPVDSRILDRLFATEPDLREKLKILVSWGPSPVPPLVVSRSAPLEVKATLRKVLLGMQRDPAAKPLLAAEGLMGFVSVDDFHYNAIRLMDELAKGVTV